MDDKQTFQVVITNQFTDGQDRELIIGKLATLFKIDNSKASRLITEPRSIIKDNIDEATAKKYHAAIIKTGAHCEVVNKAIDEQLPEIIEPIKPDTSGFVRAITESVEEHKARDVELKIIEKERQEQQDTREALSNYKNINPELFCPECGTIRSATDAICLQCGYNPQQTRTSSRNIKKPVFYVLTFAIVIAGALFLGKPFIDRFITKYKIENALQLAFDTRNQITTFIQQTNFWPNQNIDANLPKVISNEIIESIIVTENGAFTVTLRADLSDVGGQTLIFTPKLLKEKLVWNCTRGTLDEDYRPETCRTQNIISD